MARANRFPSGCHAKTRPALEAVLEQVSYPRPKISFTVNMREILIMKSFITSLTIEYQSRSSVTTNLDLGN